MHKVYIIMVNYNNWNDTIECLESVLKSSYSNYQIVVVDNYSSNDSMKHLLKWAEGGLDTWVSPKNPLRVLSFPPVKKPISYVYYTRKEAERGGNPEQEEKLRIDTRKTFLSTTYPLVFIQAGGNLGFAGGNNVGIRYALAKNDSEYIWLLNNDTVVNRNSLLELVQEAEFRKKKGEKVGIIGSKLLYYNNPSTIQGVGGKYNKWFAISKHIGVFEEDRGQYDKEFIIKKIDYVIGASMLVSKKFIDEVGLMCEDYFLYFEEIDWILRGRYKGYKIGYCWKSKVYHKEGKSIGSNARGDKKSEISDYYILKNRIVFTKKFYPECLWSVYLGFIVVVVNRIKRGQFNRIKYILKIFKEVINVKT